jgi:hypothetical protein
MGLERLTHTCRNKIGSNINLILPNAVGRLKIDWKQLIWMVRHGLKHKITGSNIRATKFQSRVRTQQYYIISNNDQYCVPNQQVVKQNPWNICKYRKRI